MRPWNIVNKLFAILFPSQTYIVLKQSNLEKAPGWMDSNSIKSVNILK